MIVRAAVVPHPPSLVPELVSGSDADVYAVRDGCAAAGVADHRVTAGADAAAQVSAPLGPEAAGTFAGVVVRLDAGSTAEPDPAMPLHALVARWLRERVDANQVTIWADE